MFCAASRQDDTQVFSTWFALNLVTAVCAAAAADVRVVHKPPLPQQCCAFAVSPLPHLPRRLLSHRHVPLISKVPSRPSSKRPLVRKPRKHPRQSRQCLNNHNGNNGYINPGGKGENSEEDGNKSNLCAILQEDQLQRTLNSTVHWLPFRPWGPFRPATHARKTAPDLRTQRTQFASERSEFSSSQSSSSWNGVYNLVAGGIAAAVAAAITCPLDVIKTKLQSGAGLSFVGVASKIVTEQGVGGLYRGLSPTMLGTVPLRAFYFWAMTAARGTLTPHFGQGALTNLIASATAGVFRSVVSSPLSITKTRMQVAGAGFFQTAKAIFAAHGIRGFYRGVLLSYWGIVEGAIQALLYEDLKQRSYAASHAKQPAEPSSTSLLMAAAVSKGVASSLLYPHEVLLVRISSGASEHASVLSTLSAVVKSEGVMGLYAGMGAHLLRTVPNTAIMFVLFELLQRSIPRLLERRPWETAASAARERCIDLLGAAQVPSKLGYA